MRVARRLSEAACVYVLGFGLSAHEFDLVRSLPSLNAYPNRMRMMFKAIVDHIDEQVTKEFGMDPRREGSAETGWIVLDYSDVVVHVFNQEQRDYYRLERLWSKVPPVVVVQ